MKDYIIEISTREEKLEKVMAQLVMIGLKLDKTFPPKEFKSAIRIPEDQRQLRQNGLLTHIIKGKVEEAQLKKLEQTPCVINLWNNSGYIPFGSSKSI